MKWDVQANAQANGLPNRSAKSIMGSVAWSGCIPTSIEQPRSSPDTLKPQFGHVFFLFNRGHSSAQRAADQPTLLFFLFFFGWAHYSGNPISIKKKEKKNMHGCTTEGEDGGRRGRGGRGGRGGPWRHDGMVTAWSQHGHSTVAPHR